MKKILFDLAGTQPKRGVRFHGGGEYCKTVFLTLMQAGSANTKIEVFYDKSKEISDDITKLLDEYSVRIYNCTNIKMINDVLHNGQYDVFFSGLPYDYGNGLIVPEKTKFIYSIHGLREIEKPYDSMMFMYGKRNFRNILKQVSMLVYPKYWEMKYRKKIEDLLRVTKNRTVLTISNHSKYSIIANFPGLKKDEVKVFYAPKKFVKLSTDDSLEKIKGIGLEDKQYFLMISADRWLKNNLRAAIAFDRLFSQNSDIVQNAKVVMTGVKDQEVFYKHIQNRDKFIMLEYVEAGILESLYSHAHAFVYPTLNEGFGYPPLEAMKYGTLSLCSAVTSVPEVCGSAVLYFNPYDITEIENRILQSYDYSITQSARNKMQKQFEKIGSLQRHALDNIVSEILNN